MENRKCPSCGGEMELSVSSKCMVCPFCDTHIDVEIKDDGNGALLDTRMFDILWDIKALKKHENVVTCLDSFRYCLNSLKTADSVAKYIRTALINDEDVASEGINQNRIDKIMPKIADLMDSDEHIIVYGDDGLISRGKRKTKTGRFNRHNSRPINIRSCIFRQVGLLSRPSETLRHVLSWDREGRKNGAEA